MGGGLTGDETGTLTKGVRFLWTSVVSPDFLTDDSELERFVKDSGEVVSGKHRFRHG